MPSNAIVQAAIKAAKQSEEEFRLGAVLYKGGAILRTKPNSIKYVGYVAKHFPYVSTRHAEVHVITGVPADILAICSILVVRLDRKDNLVLAKPCEACQKVLANANIRRIYYSNDDGNIERLK